MSSDYTNPENDETRYGGDDEFQFDQPQPLVPGRRFGEHRNYRLDRKLGEGGMGQVWLATEIAGGEDLRQVVCKLLPKPVQGDAPEMKQIRKVFELTQTLTHPNICRLLGMKNDPDFGWFFVMDYANGESLYTWFANQPNSEDGLPLDVVLPILKPLAEALDYAHSRNVVHRDIKPQNVMFTTLDGQKLPWLVDFGIAARVHQTATMTMGGARASQGTPNYMAPEQLMGGAQDGRTDQFSFAVMTYLLLSGNLPFQGADMALAMQIMNKTPDELPNQPDHVNAALQKALSKDKKDRFATCGEFVCALGGVTLGTAVPYLQPAKKSVPFSWDDLRSEQAPLVQEYVQERRACLESLEDYLPNSPRVQRLAARMQDVCDRLYQSYENALRQRQVELNQLETDGCRPDSRLMVTAQKDVAKLEQEQAMFMGSSLESHLQGISVLTWCPEAKSVWEEEERKRREAEAKKNPFYTWPSLPAGTRRTKTVNGVEFAFRWCPAGKFTMGSPEDEEDSEDDEEDSEDDETQHEVTLTQGFWMLETEVTQAMWQSVMGNNPSNFKGDDRPVEQVSWYDCQEFCEKLTSKIGMKITLPTEAQWEYACRAGTTGPYAGELDKMGWYDGNSGSHTYPVGQKQANAWGLYDMHGNVWEWCQDWYGDYPTGSVEDPTGPNSGSYRVYRGGGWDLSAQYCRSASRDWYSAVNRYDSLGFRAVGCPSSSK